MRWPIFYIISNKINQVWYYISIIPPLLLILSWALMIDPFLCLHVFTAGWRATTEDAELLWLAPLAPSFEGLPELIIQQGPKKGSIASPRRVQQQGRNYYYMISYLIYHGLYNTKNNPFYILDIVCYRFWACWKQISELPCCVNGKPCTCC